MAGASHAALIASYAARSAETTWAGAIANFALANSKTIPSTFGPEHATRHAYCVISGAANANADPTGDITDVTIDGVGCTQLFLTKSGASHASAWGCALPTGTSGNCVVRRTIGNGLGRLLASVFTVNYLRNPLTMLDKTDFVNDVQDDPWSATLITQRGGCALYSVTGLGPDSSNAVTTSTADLIIDDSRFGTAPNDLEVCSAHYDNTPADVAFPFSFDTLGSGNLSATAISLR